MRSGVTVAVQLVVDHASPGAWSQAPRQTMGSNVKRPSAVVSPRPDAELAPRGGRAAAS